MKRKISDLLDGCRVDMPEPERNASLSSKRIKELTMSKIKKNQKTHRLGVRILVSAAIIASLSVTVFAAERIFGAGDWFRDILNAQLAQDQQRADEYGWDVSVRETLGQDQVEVINDMGMVYENMTKSDQGTSITLNAAYADEYVLHLYFRVEAPEGTILPDGITYHFGDVFGEGHDYLVLEEDAPYKPQYRNVLIEALSDSDPQDNSKDFHVTVTGDQDNALRFNDGVTKHLHITGIYEQKVNVDGDEDATVPLILCDVSFDVTLKNEPRRVELDMAGLEYSGTYVRNYRHPEGVECNGYCPVLNEDGSHTESWGYTVTPKQFIIGPMGVEWAVDYTVENPQASVGLHYTVVMKDGTSPVKALHGAGAKFSDTRVMEIDLFTAPIDLENIDYIIIGDPEFGQTHKVYLPQ